MRTQLINKWCTVVIYSSRRQLHYLVLDHATSFKTVEDNIRREFQGSITIAILAMLTRALLTLHVLLTLLSLFYLDVKGSTKLYWTHPLDCYDFSRAPAALKSFQVKFERVANTFYSHCFFLNMISSSLSCLNSEVLKVGA